MKKLIIIILFNITSAFAIQAQAPQKFSYQTVIRNSSNQLLANQQVGIKISVIQGSETGIVVYSERHTPNTNSNGLATLSIGTGSVLSGNFQNINWASGPYYIQTETDPNGGNNYTITSTQQLLSVPYALYAETSGSSTPGPQGPAGPQGPIGATGPQGSPSNDDQELSVSGTGDTLFLRNGGFVIIPGISVANQINIDCSNLNIFNSNINYNTIVDIDGNVYKTVVIGNQTWMAENLRVTRYQNGDIIPNISDSNTWPNINTGAFCEFSSDTILSCSYGNIYNWFTTVDTRNVCPIGWKVASEEDFNILKLFLDPNAIGTIGNNNNLAGGYLKSISNFWSEPNIEATNSTGFSAIPTVLRTEIGPTSGLPVAFFLNDSGSQAQWWTSSSYGLEEGFVYVVSTFGSSLTKGSNSMTTGLSVRCILE